MDEKQVARIVNDTLSSFFSSQTDKERFVSTQRIPFICRDIATIKDDMRGILDSIATSRDRLEVKMDDVYVTKEAFEPIKMLVYGFVGLSLVAIVGGLLALVIKTT